MYVFAVFVQGVHEPAFVKEQFDRNCPTGQLSMQLGGKGQQVMSMKTYRWSKYACGM